MTQPEPWTPPRHQLIPTSPFYKQKWFIILVVVVAVLIIAAVLLYELLQSIKDLLW